MKKNVFYFVLSMFLLQACSKDSNNSNGGVTALTITASKTSLFADGLDETKLTVKDQDGKDVTNSVNFKRNTFAVYSSTQVFEYGEHGVYKFTASSGSITSNEVTVTVADPGPAKFTTKVIAEDCTGAWCGWCPRLTHKFDSYMHRYPNLFTIGVHNGDIYALSSIESTLRAKFGVTGFPSAIINRDIKFNDNGNINSLADSTGLLPYLKARAVAGLAINSTRTGNTLNITTKVKFDANISQGLKIVVCVVEDGLVLGQTNYYNNNNTYPGNPYFSAGSTITNFVHNGVLRVATTPILGADVTASSQTKNNEFTHTSTADLTGINATNAKVVAFVLFADGTTKKGILNAQWAAVGTNKNYD